MTTDQAITEALAEDAAERAPAGQAYMPLGGIPERARSAGGKFVAVQDYDELRQQLADVTNERDALRAERQWIKCSDRLPSRPSGTATEYIICTVVDGKQFVFSAQWLEGYALYSETHEDADETGYMEGHGWYDVKESVEYAGWYEPIDSGDVTHWMPLPAPPEGE